MIQGLTYAIVTTDDVPRARRFFTEQLGLSTEADHADEFSQFTTRDGTTWALWKTPELHKAGDVMLYLQVDDPDAAYRTWQERGVEMVTEPHDEPFGRTFAFRDPDGRVLHAWAPARPTQT